MRHQHVRNQLDTAFGNVESALRNLSDRLDDVLPDVGRRRVSRARRAIRRTASSVAERVRPQHGSGLVDDTRRTVREHPLMTILAAVLAGFAVWSVLRMTSSSRTGLSTEHGRTLAGRFRAAQGEGAESPLHH